MRVIIYGEGRRRRRRENIAALVATRELQSNVNISSTLTLFEVNSRRVTYMDRLTSACVRHGQTICELMHITNTSLKLMHGLEHITVSIRGSSVIEH